MNTTDREEQIKMKTRSVEEIQREIKYAKRLIVDGEWGHGYER